MMVQQFQCISGAPANFELHWRIIVSPDCLRLRFNDRQFSMRSRSRWPARPLARPWRLLPRIGLAAALLVVGLRFALLRLTPEIDIRDAASGAPIADAVARSGNQ